MNYARLVLAAGLISIFSLGLLLQEPSPASAEDSRLVRLYGGIARSEGVTTEIVRIEPENLWIKKGTVVIWIHAARASDCLRIVFEEGKKCEDVTDAPSGFKTEGPCYVTSWVDFGGTSSLKFNEAGTFDYYVDAKGFGPEVRKKGTIVVH